MSKAEELALLKSNLQLLTSVHDDFLAFLLRSAEGMMKREGIRNDHSADYYSCKIDYAAYLFRKRASNTSSSTLGTGFSPSGGETAMPRFLRYSLNNLLMSQKIAEGGA